MPAKNGSKRNSHLVHPAGSDLSRPVRPRRGEDDKGRDCLVLDGVDGRRRPSTTDAQNCGARAACQGWQSDRRRTAVGRPWRRPVQDEDDTVRLPSTAVRLDD
ncbi:hypothetical protein B9Z19DRAFT_1138931 [Tuber borchii]|uniref:Uncharacterized protein n=1 Tax=Tuber borchii TaxID=42251 RepID=A0A2T6Z9K3_TUBBO|nr:hypothetical protein B9Z19DRAFT_1138931 [Tuber borchii]